MSRPIASLWEQSFWMEIIFLWLELGMKTTLHFRSPSSNSELDGMLEIISYYFLCDFHRILVRWFKNIVKCNASSITGMLSAHQYFRLPSLHQSERNTNPNLTYIYVLGAVSLFEVFPLYFSDNLAFIILSRLVPAWSTIIYLRSHQLKLLTAHVGCCLRNNNTLKSRKSII